MSRPVPDEHFCVAGGNPWDVKKKKAKKKKALKVDEAEEGDILENGDVRTKGAPLIPCHAKMTSRAMLLK